MSYTSRSTPVYKSLLEIKTFGGVEDKLALSNFLLSTIIVFSFHFLPYILVMLATHILLKQITKKDPYARKNYIRYNQQSDHYDPWIHTQLKTTRPYGQGVLC